MFALRWLLLLWFGLLPFSIQLCAAELARIQVDQRQQGFETLDEKGQAKKFVPWGFNYDHDAVGDLLEDYWTKDWPRVAEDFQEMKALGANVVRIHLQFGKFMQTAQKPNQGALEQLAKLVQLAEETGLYLNITGLACYHKQDVPPWYDKLNEQARWDAQAVFWSAVAQTCAESPSIFCYDLMNEPVVPAGNKPGKSWLGPGFGDKYFVQYISLDRADRDRPEIALAWVKSLTAAIREHDDRHLITVGLVPWSLDRPGLSSGFVPEAIAPELDFISVHLYPESGKLEENLETLRGFAVGKPVVIEETFPLKCKPEEFREFLKASSEIASGWIGFYWGQTAADYEQKEKKTIGEAVTLEWLRIFEEERSEFVSP